MIPLVSNLGFTEITTSGTVSDIAGLKNNLPVQYYKMGDDVIGQLKIGNTAVHKKIIMDMNGKTLAGNGASPFVYDNESIDLEVRGLGFITAGGVTSVTQDSSETSVSIRTVGSDRVFQNKSSLPIENFIVNNVNLGELGVNASVTSAGSTEDWKGFIPNTQAISASGSGSTTVSVGAGGKGSTGSVVITVADNNVNFPAVDGDEVYAGMEYTPDNTGEFNSSQVYPKSYGNATPVGVSSSAFPNGSMGSSMFAINTDLFSQNFNTANYTYTNSRQGRCATRLINDLGSPVRFTYSGTIDGNNFSLTGNGASASGTVSGGSATGITTSVAANNSYEFFFTNTSHVLKFYRSGRSDSNQVNKWFWSNRPTSTNGANNLNRQGPSASDYGTTYTMTSVTLPNAGTYVNGKAFTVTNNNDTDISFVGVSASGTIASGATTTVSNLSSTAVTWNYTGTRSAINESNEPQATDNAFSGTSVSSNSTGVPQTKINLTSYTGVYSRTT